MVTFAVAITFVKTYGERVSWFSRGECTVDGRWLYPPRAEADALRLTALDLEAVHRDLLPQWVVTTSRSGAESIEEREAFEALRGSVEPDPNLTAILDEMREIVLMDEVAARAERLRYLTWAWSSYLDAAQLPFWVQGGVGVHPHYGGFFYIVAYQTVADFTVDIAGTPQRVRVVSRLDRLNLRERQLGSVTQLEDGAVVIADRLQDFAIDSIWPLMDGAIQESPDSFDAAFAVDVSREVGAGLDPEDLAVLVRSATARERLTEVVDTVAGRQSCSGFALINTPVEGYSEERLFRYALLALLSENTWCPRLKVEEAEELIKYSRVLRSEHGLQDAVESLIAWFARTVTVHEGRHLADETSGGAPEVDCEGCGPPGVSAEVSAYVASFAWGPAPATAYYQACRAVRHNANPHAAAMEAIQQGLGHVCENGPPTALRDRARALERRLLGRSDPIILPDDFPIRVAVSAQQPPPRVGLVQAAR